MNVTINIPDELKDRAESIEDLQTQFVEWLSLKVTAQVEHSKRSVDQVFEEIDRIRNDGFTLGDVSLRDAIDHGRR